MSVRQWWLVTAILMLTVACGGGGDGDNGGDDDGNGNGGGGLSQNLDGHWYGVVQDDNFILMTLRLTVSGNSIPQIEEGGAISGVTGVITEEANQVYSVALSDGRDAGFVTDTSATHAMFVDDEFNVGVVEKGATVLPVYSNTDIDGNYVGIEVQTDFTGFSQNALSGSCAHPACAATAAGITTDFVLSNVDPAFGRWLATFTDSAMQMGMNATVLLSADKTFAASAACINPTFSIADCKLRSWERQ